MNGNSSTNTILLVVVLVILIGASVWYLNNRPTEENQAEAGIDLILPAGDESE